MDNQREELPRIAVDTLHDWQRVKASYTSAALTAFEKRTASRTPAKRDALRVHLHKVCGILVMVDVGVLDFDILMCFR